MKRSYTNRQYTLTLKTEEVIIYNKYIGLACKNSVTAFLFGGIIVRKYILIITTITMVLLVLGGCATSSDYCCTSNDQCLTTSEGLHSCSMDACGKCVLVAPLTITITSPGGWKDPMVGQTNYSIELTATGGETLTCPRS